MTALDVWILILLMVIGFAWAAWARLKERRQSEKASNHWQCCNGLVSKRTT